MVTAAHIASINPLPPPAQLAARPGSPAARPQPNPKFYPNLEEPDNDKRSNFVFNI